MSPKSLLSLHWIPNHRGDLNGVPDAQWFARWQPAFAKIITIDEKPPYLEDVPPASMIIVRNHPMSENYGNRGGIPAAATQVTPAPTGPVPPTATATEADVYAAYCATYELKRYTAPVTDPHSSYVPPAGIAEQAAAAAAAGTVESPEQVAANHAAACARMAAYCESKGVPRSRVLFEGLNEPMLWAVEPPDWTARYYKAFLEGLHSSGLRGVVGNFGVGWPGNGGVADAPVQWDFFKPVIDVMLPGDYLGLHEYWALNGPQENWRWWAGRFLQCPYRVPILITECGIDTGVTGNFYGGWWSLPGSVDEKCVRYLSELSWYEQQCLADGRIAGFCVFTYDIGSSHWEKFDIRHEPLVTRLITYVDSRPAENWKPVETKTLDQRLVAEFGTAYEDLRATLLHDATATYQTRELAAIRRIILHHTGTPSQSTTWEAVARYHVNTRGWPGIGYHLGLRPDGKVSYLGDINTIRYHAGSANTDSIGICCSGDYRTEQPTTVMAGNFRRLVALLESFLGRDLPIIPHRDVADTVCPGDNLMSLITAAPTLEQVLIAEGDAHQLIQFNPTAALQAAAFRAGFTPNSPEFETVYNGVTYVGQRVENPGTGKVRVYYAAKGDWGNVKFVEKP
jgi:hypothetical protein